MGIDGPTTPRPTEPAASDELLDEALKESFPASDPLSFWSGRDRRTARGTSQTVEDPEEQ